MHLRNYFQFRNCTVDMIYGKFCIEKSLSRMKITHTFRELLYYVSLLIPHKSIKAWLKREHLELVPSLDFYVMYE